MVDESDEGAYSALETTLRADERGENVKSDGAGAIASGSRKWAIRGGRQEGVSNGLLASATTPSSVSWWPLSPSRRGLRRAWSQKVR